MSQLMPKPINMAIVKLANVPVSIYSVILICWAFPSTKTIHPIRNLTVNLIRNRPNKALGVLLYDYCVIGYDVEFSYKGKTYYLMDDGEGVISDSQFTKRIEVFDSPMNLLENFKIDGKTLIELAPEIDDINPV